MDARADPRSGQRALFIKRDYFDMWGDIFNGIPYFRRPYRKFMRRHFGNGATMKWPDELIFIPNSRMAQRPRSSAWTARVRAGPERLGRWISGRKTLSEAVRGWCWCAEMLKTSCRQDELECEYKTGVRILQAILPPCGGQKTGRDHP